MKQDQKKMKNLELKGIQQLEEITELRAREELIKEKLKIEKLERDREKQLYEINKVQKNLDQILTSGTHGLGYLHKKKRIPKLTKKTSKITKVPKTSPSKSSPSKSPPPKSLPSKSPPSKSPPPKTQPPPKTSPPPKTPSTPKAPSTPTPSTPTPSTPTLTPSTPTLLTTTANVSLIKYGGSKSTTKIDNRWKKPNVTNNKSSRMNKSAELHRYHTGAATTTYIRGNRFTPHHTYQTEHLSSSTSSFPTASFHVISQSKDERWLDLGMAPEAPKSHYYKAMKGSIGSTTPFDNDPRSQFKRSPTTAIYHPDILEDGEENNYVENNSNNNNERQEEQEQEQEEKKNAVNEDNSKEPLTASMLLSGSPSISSNKNKKRRKKVGRMSSNSGDDVKNGSTVSQVELMERERMERIIAREERKNKVILFNVDQRKGKSKRVSSYGKRVKRRPPQLSLQEKEVLRRSELIRVRKEFSDMHRQAAANAIRPSSSKRVKRATMKKKSSSIHSRSGGRAHDGIRQRWTSMKVNIKTSKREDAGTIELKLKKLRKEREKAEVMLSQSMKDML